MIIHSVYNYGCKNIFTFLFVARFIRF